MLPSILIKDNQATTRQNSNLYNIFQKVLLVVNFCNLTYWLIDTFDANDGNWDLRNTLYTLMHLMEVVLLTLVFITFMYHEKHIVGLYNELYSVEDELEKNGVSIMLSTSPLYFYGLFFLITFSLKITSLIRQERLDINFKYYFSYWYADVTQMSVLIRLSFIINVCDRLFAMMNSKMEDTSINDSTIMCKSIRRYSVLHAQLCDLLRLNNTIHFIPSAVFIYYNQTFVVYRIYYIYTRKVILSYFIMWIIFAFMIVLGLNSFAEKCKNQVPTNSVNNFR